MSEHAQHKVTPPTVERNGVTVELKEQTFGKKSKNHAGHKFFAPEFSLNNFIDQGLPWIGESWVLDAVNSTLRRIFGEISVDPDNIDATTGKPIMENLQKDWAEFTTGFAKLSVLRGQIDELTDQAVALTDLDAFLDAEHPDYNDVTAKLKEITEKLKPLKHQEAKIKADYAERTAKKEAAAKNQPVKQEQAA